MWGSILATACSFKRYQWCVYCSNLVFRGCVILYLEIYMICVQLSVQSNGLRYLICAQKDELKYSSIERDVIER
ncbi:Uncharacterized protein ACO02O_04781 [Dirofilaria immitis]